MGFLGGHTGERGTARKDWDQGKGSKAVGLSSSPAADKGHQDLTASGKQTEGKQKENT